MAKEDKSPDSEKRPEDESKGAKTEGSKSEASESKAEASETRAKESQERAEADDGDEATDDASDEETASGGDGDSGDDDGGDDDSGDDDGGDDDSGDDDSGEEEEEEEEEEEAVSHTTSGVERLEKTPHSHPAPSAEALAAAAHDHDHGLAHTTTVRLLVAVFSALVVLTIATVAVTRVDLGGQGNLVVALVIATIKAGLVVAFFMHLIWDRKLNLLAFLSAVLFLILFLSLAITDRKEYQPYIDQFSSDTANQAE